ncbi:hypothetical protein GGH99_006097, partial [Coemansia sp. RSA 1285]
SGKQAPASAAAAISNEAAASASSQKTASTEHGCMPAQSLEGGKGYQAHQSTQTPYPSTDNSGIAEESDVARLLEMWWDQILLFFVRHRATAAFVAWFGVSLFDIMDLHMPAEWLVFTFFSFSVFVQAFGVSILLFAALTVSMTIINVAMFYLIPLSATSLFSTIVVCMLLVRGIHGLDAKGWAITALMSLTRMHSPWCEILPEYLQAPIAAYCTSFGILWLIYQNSKKLERLLDPMCLLLGIIPPIPPRLSIVEVSDTSVVICWSHLPGYSSLIVPELDSSASSGTIALHGGLADHSASKQNTFPSTSALENTGSTATIQATAPQTMHMQHSATHGNEQSPTRPSNATSLGSGHMNASVVTALNIGRFLTIDRKALPEARVSRYEIEVDGHIVGHCKPEDGLARIQGLNPASMHQLRVWAISKSRGRAPSLPVFVSTHAAKEDDVTDGGRVTDRRESTETTPVDIEHLYEEIGASQRAIKQLEDNISSLKAQSEQERTQLQKEISVLRARRKEEESARSGQREKIRELEAEKRQLDKEKLQLEKDISMVRTRKQKALDHIKDQERQAEKYKRNAKALETTMERERRDHDQKQTELKSTIDMLKMEVEKAKSRLDDLSKQHSELSAKLKSKRTELKAQEKKNTALDSKVKESERRRRQKIEIQKEMKTRVEELQSEMDALVPQLKEATSKRQKLEMEASSRRPPPSPSLHVNSSMEMTRPSAAFLPSYRLSGANIAGVAGSSTAPTHGYPNVLVSSRWMPASNSSFTMDRNVYGGAAGRRSVDAVSAAGSKHIRSSSFADSALVPHTDGFSSSCKPASQRSTAQPAYGAVTGDSAASRHSAEFSDMYSLWGRRSPLISGTAAAATPGITSSAGLGTTGAFESGAMPLSSSIGTISSEFGLDPTSRLNHVAYWDNEIVSPTTQATNTAEASALSILKDTDLAYPTPERSGRKAYSQYSTSILQGDSIKLRQSVDTPSHTMFSNDMSSRNGHNALGRMFSESADSLGQDTSLRRFEDRSQHLRFNSLEI